MLQLAWKNILFRKMRSVLTILGITSSITLVVFMSAIMTATEQNLLESMGHLGGIIRIQQKSAALDGASIDTVPAGLFLSADEVNEILATAEGYDPEASSPMIEQVVVSPASPNSPPQVTLRAVQPGREMTALSDAPIAAGDPHLTGSQGIILGAAAHKYLSDKAGHELTVGEQIELPGTPNTWTIAAIASKHDMITDTLVVVSLADAQSVYRRGSTVSYVALSYPVDEAKAAGARLKEQLPDFEVVTNEMMLNSVMKALDAQRSFFSLINGTVYMTAIAIIFMVMYTSVMERTKEIGTMRAVGASRGAVLGSVLTEASFFALTGSILGGAVGWYLMYTWDLITLEQYVLQALQVVGAAVLIALLSSLYPAVRAARLNPLEALRYE